MHHAAAEPVWRLLEAGAYRLTTSHLVIAETLDYLGYAVDSRYAAAVGRRIYGSTAITIFEHRGEEIHAALDELDRVARRHKVSFTDSSSFAIMRARGVTTAFTFDRDDFARAGFEVIP